MSRRWREEEAQTPVDLRLIPTALAVWGGALVGIATADRTTVAGLLWGAVALFLTLAVAVLRQARWWAGALSISAGFVAALMISTIYWQSAAQNPLTVAAGEGSWASLRLTVATAARKLPSPFPTAAADSSSADAPSIDAVQPDVTGPWLLTATAQEARVGDRDFDPAMTISVMATGAIWPQLVPLLTDVITTKAGRSSDSLPRP